MALQELFANNAISTLATAITSSAVIITLRTGDGSLFPNPTPGSQFFRLSLTDAATKTNHEICYVTQRGGTYLGSGLTNDQLVVTRNAEQVPNLTFPSSTGAAWSAGDIASNEVTAGMMTNTYSPSNDQANVVRYAADSGAANAYVCAFNPPIPTGTVATELIFKPLNTNTGASTITCNSGTSYAILAANGSALIGGEIQANGLVKIIFNAVAGAYFIEFSLNAATVAFNTATANTPTTSNQVATKGYVDSLVGLGVGQTALSTSDSSLTRSSLTGYTNSTGKAIFVSISALTAGAYNKFYIGTYPAGRLVADASISTGGTNGTLSWVVPNGVSYWANIQGSYIWSELR